MNVIVFHEEKSKRCEVRIREEDKAGGFIFPALSEGFPFYRGMDALTVFRLKEVVGELSLLCCYKEQKVGSYGQLSA